MAAVSWRRRIIYLVVLVVLVRGLSGGCTSSTLPARLTREQRALVNSTRFHATVGVDQYKFSVYSDRLIPALQATGLFDRVDSLARFPEPPTFVARVARPIYGTATIPFLTGISLGLIPNWGQEEHGDAFWLIPSARRQDSLLVDFSYRGPSVLGWVCVLLNLTPSFTAGDPDGHPRFSQALAYTIAVQGPEIASLAATKR